MKHDTDIPKLEDWEAELKKNPWPSGRLRWIDGRYLYTIVRYMKKCWKESKRKKLNRPFSKSY
jgi:hypothetical protein